MDTKKLFKKYYSKLAFQGLLKALLFGATCGFGAAGVTAFVMWLARAGRLEAVLGAAGVFLAVTAVAAAIAYLQTFRPTTAKIAALIDKLGLEERIVTMCEMQKNPTYIAMLQREDARAKLNTVSHRDVSLKFSKVAVICLAAAFAFGASMTTVSALAPLGRGDDKTLENPSDSSDDPEEEQYVTVTYVAGDGGFIDGETVQRIKKGTDAHPVTAVPLEGYVFAAWSDKVPTAGRWDWSITEDFMVEALFEPAPPQGSTGEGGEGQEGEGQEGEGNGGNSGDQNGSSGDQNGDKGDGNADGGGDGDGNADGSADGSGGGGGENGDQSGSSDGGDSHGNGGDSEGVPGKGDNPYGDQPHPGGASPGNDTDNNNIIDGKTDYHDAVDTEGNKEDLANDDSIPPELKDILDRYFDSLKP